MPIMMHNKISHRLSVPLLKRVNVTAEMVGVQSAVGTACEKRARNAVARRVHRDEFQAL